MRTFALFADGCGLLGANGPATSAEGSSRAAFRARSVERAGAFENDGSSALRSGPMSELRRLAMRAHLLPGFATLVGHDFAVGWRACGRPARSPRSATQIQRLEGMFMCSVTPAEEGGCSDYRLGRRGSRLWPRAKSRTIAALWGRSLSYVLDDAQQGARPNLRNMVSTCRDIDRAREGSRRDTSETMMAADW